MRELSPVSDRIQRTAGGNYVYHNRDYRWLLVNMYQIQIYLYIINLGL